MNRDSAAHSGPRTVPTTVPGPGLILAQRQPTPTALVRKHRPEIDDFRPESAQRSAGHARSNVDCARHCAHRRGPPHAQGAPAFGPVRTLLKLANACVNSSLNAERRKYRCRRCSLTSARHRAQSLHPHGRAARPNPALVQGEADAEWCKLVRSVTLEPCLLPPFVKA